MRRRIEALADQLEEFVSEDGHDALVITCAPEAVGFVGAAVDLNEQRGSRDVSVPFFEPFRDVATFANRIATHVQGLAAALKFSEPPQVARGSLVALLTDFARSIRVLGDVRVALVLCPSEIACEAAYAKTVLELVQGARRCSPHLRVAIRDTADRTIRDALRRAGAPVLEVALDVDARAMRDALAEDGLDRSADPRVRAAAALTVAMADAAEGRVGEALAALSTLADHHHHHGDAVSRGLCFVLASSLLAREGELDEGRACLGQGLGLALQAGSPVLALNAAMTGGELALLASDRAEADAHFDLAARIAARMGRGTVVAHALLRRAAVFVAASEPARALEAFACAAVAARDGRAHGLERDALAGLSSLYRDAGMHAEADAAECQRLASERRAESTHARHAHAHAP